MTPRTIEAYEWRWVYITGGLLLIVLSLPFLWAYATAVPDRIFMGILVNPIDGMSYQAKMLQGYNGSWLFELPYTPEPHTGVFVYTFYVGLGHLARLLNVEPILVFHVVRLVGGMFMFAILYRFSSDWTDSIDQRRICWALTVLGAGFGWLALLAGYQPQPVKLTPDVYWLPEGFPLQAVYANAHLPWAIGIAAAIAHILLTAALVDPRPEPETSLQTVAVAVGAIVLVSMSPFAMIPMGLGYATLLVRLWRQDGRFPRREFAWGSLLIIFGLPLALYNVWVFSEANPIFHAWMLQNATLSPPVWDYLIAYGPLLILAAIGVWGSRENLEAGDFFLLGWLVANVILLYAPFTLQRRFVIGLIIPLAVFAARGLWRVIAMHLPNRFRFGAVLLAFVTFVPTTILVIVFPLLGTLAREQGYYYYISRNEGAALRWLGSHANSHDVVLASPDLALFVPTVGPRVVYGHPFETLNAAVRREEVESYYAGHDCGVIQVEGVDYIIVGPRERLLMTQGASCLPDSAPVFTAGDVDVYAVNGQ